MINVNVALIIVLEHGSPDWLVFVTQASTPPRHICELLALSLKIIPAQHFSSQPPTTITMAANGDRYGNDFESDSDSGPDSPGLEPQQDNGDHIEEIDDKPIKSALKKSTQKEAAPAIIRPYLPPQTEPKDLVPEELTPLTPEIIARQATINIGTIGHVAHGKSTVVKAISGVQTVRFKNELERNITIKLGYANAKFYQCDNPACPRPTCFRSYKSDKEVDPPCERDGCEGTYRLLRHVS